MRRDNMIKKVASSDGPFDVAIVGGGATGLGIAVDAASRGYSVVLLERDDFAKGTSGRSTKLVHGGVRYLAQGNIRLVMEALRERGLLRKNAPELVRDLAFVVPAYRWWEIPFYYIGLKVYDLLSGRLSLGQSSFASQNRVIGMLPTIRRQGLKGGIIYHDGQFDDSRMAVSLARTAEDQGAVVLNYAEVNRMDKTESPDVFNLGFIDRFSGEQHSFSARTVFNAAGVFVDEILNLENEKSRPLIKPSRGAHIVVDARFMPGDHGLMIPKTSDGRILFALPWHGKVLLGTTDAPVQENSREPVPSEAEIDFILKTAKDYLAPYPVRKDIRSVFAGLRPLAAPEHPNQKTKEISRGHRVLVSGNQMITIIGGKWTTYRKMAEDAVDKAIALGRLPKKKCVTESLPLWVSELDRRYGLRFNQDTPEEDQDQSDRSAVLVDGYPWTPDDIRYMIREEYALTIEDVLSRRTRLLILDAQAARQISPRIGQLLEDELPTGRYDAKADEAEFMEVSKHYLAKESKN